MTAKKTAKKTVVKRAPTKKKEPFTHIDRSNGTLLRRSDLNKEKPWLSPISGQATVEELAKDEIESLPEVER